MSLVGVLCCVLCCVCLVLCCVVSCLWCVCVFGVFVSLVCLYLGCCIVVLREQRVVKGSEQRVVRVVGVVVAIVVPADCNFLLFPDRPSLTVTLCVLCVLCVCSVCALCVLCVCGSPALLSSLLFFKCSLVTVDQFAGVADSSSRNVKAALWSQHVYQQHV